MSDLKHTDPALVTEVKRTETPLAGRYTTGYGPKIPTGYMVKYANKWRRVYVVNYGNAGSAYIVVNGEDHYLDTDTEYRLLEGH